MEISIFERSGKTWTRFKVKAWELQICTKLLERYVDIKKPVNRISDTFILRWKVIC